MACHNTVHFYDNFFTEIHSYFTHRMFFFLLLNYEVMSVSIIFFLIIYLLISKCFIYIKVQLKKHKREGKRKRCEYNLSMEIVVAKRERLAWC